MTIHQILKSIFKETKLPPFEIELILAHTLNKTREFLLAHPETILTKLQIKNYKLLISRRLKGVPFAYLTGHKEFYGFDFLVNKHVLIPRPETELIIEEAMKIAESRKQKADEFTIIDIGTGSGCIIIALAKLLKNYKLQITNYKLFGTDISALALNIARQNARKHNVQNKIKFLHGNLLGPLLKLKKLEIGNWKFVILANLPYLTPAQIKKSPSIKYEPKLALSAGNDGLKYYRQLFKQIKKLKSTDAAESPRGDSAGTRKMLILNPPLRKGVIILCEIDPSQKNRIIQLVKKELPNALIEIKKDLRGHNRLAIIKICRPPLSEPKAWRGAGG